MSDPAERLNDREWPGWRGNITEPSRRRAPEAPDVASVLAGLREEMTALAGQPLTNHLQAGMRYAIALVEAAQQRLAPPVSDRPAPEPGDQP